jgi:Ca-activated chloride channel family protein
MDLLYPFTTMSFQAPAVLLVPFLLLFLLLTRKGHAASAPCPSAKILAEVPRSLRQKLRAPILGILGTLAVLFFSIAAARPQRVQVLTSQKESRNIMLSIDVSPSMGAQDFAALLGSVSRLRAVKEVVAQFVEARKGDRLGLVVFGGGAFLQSPLTLDHVLVRQLVERLQVGMAGEGTAIGDGLGVALKRAESLPAKSASIILLTDGVSNAGSVNPLKAAKVAADLGIKIHAIGIGSSKPVTVIQPGNILSNLIQRQVEFDEDTLKEIARLTGGTYFNADNVEGLQEVYAQIDRLERSAEEESTNMIAEELFPPFAAFGLLAYVFYLLLAQSVFMRVPE